MLWIEGLTFPEPIVEPTVEPIVHVALSKRSYLARIAMIHLSPSHPTLSPF